MVEIKQQIKASRIDDLKRAQTHAVISTIHSAAMRVLLSLLLIAIAAHAAAPRPNILFLIADNWAYEHASANGCNAVSTPVFDRIAREGMRFENAYCPVPSCSPTRSCILTGRPAHQLRDMASLWSRFLPEFPLFTDALAEHGYHVGYTGKGWAPGKHAEFGRQQNPAGPQHPSFSEFLAARKPEQPFFFWHGSIHTSLHRFKTLDGIAAGIYPAKIRIPAYLPDTPEVRREIASYLAAVEQMDADYGQAITELEKSGQLEKTVIFYLSDNGWQMPRGLANCHDSGSHVPFAVRWPGKIAAGTTSSAFISLTDLAPTFLELAGISIWPEMQSRSILNLLTGQEEGNDRDHLFLERERHANVRHGDLSYPCRAIHTADHLYIRNLRPDRWPAGDPEQHFAVGPYGDVDPTLTKQHILDHREEPTMKPFFEICFAKRPTEELYDLRSDPDQIHNLAQSPPHQEIRARLARQIEAWQHQTADPRLDPTHNLWDTYPYLGSPAKKSR
jgi:N-sulfoglucosamine sulfohydrolase